MKCSMPLAGLGLGLLVFLVGCQQAISLDVTFKGTIVISSEDNTSHTVALDVRLTGTSVEDSVPSGTVDAVAFALEGQTASSQAHLAGGIY